jgi:S1-C subfamily serine protease
MKKIGSFILLLTSLLILTACQDFLSYDIKDYELLELPTIINQRDEPTTLDIEDLVNQLSLEIIPSNVTVKTSLYQSFGIFRTNEVNYFGSGVIFYENDVFYYVLTNEHVISKDSENQKVSYEIKDYKNNTHKAYLYEGSNNEDVDLAILFFEKDQNDYPVISINDAPLDISDKVIAVGQPEGQVNTITFGEVIDFTQTNVKNREDEYIIREFEAIQHTAYVNSGSSGGMLLDYNLSLVGINFAGAEEDGIYQYTFSIPVSIIIDYLNELMNQEVETDIA